MFGFFERSIGVANVLDYDGRIDPMPTFVSRERSAAGFAEALAHAGSPLPG
jgi:hypothetical protein